MPDDFTSSDARDLLSRRRLKQLLLPGFLNGWLRQVETHLRRQNRMRSP